MPCKQVVKRGDNEKKKEAFEFNCFEQQSKCT
jgi:hypothetical protein